MQVWVWVWVVVHEDLDLVAVGGGMEREISGRAGQCRGRLRKRLTKFGRPQVSRGVEMAVGGAGLEPGMKDSLSRHPDITLLLVLWTKHP